jgi:hypothetical protein
LIKEMERVGVELTTSAPQQHSQAAVYPLFFITYLKGAAMERELYNQIPRSISFILGKYGIKSHLFSVIVGQNSPAMPGASLI